MTWYFIGAAIITVLFALNAVHVGVLRSRGVLRKPMPMRGQLNRSIPVDELVPVLLPVAVLLACLAARTLAPESWLAQTMASPWAIACLIPYAAAISAVGAVAAHLLRRHRQRAQA